MLGMPGMREFSPGNCCYPGQLERKPWDTSENLWLDERSFPPYSTKIPWILQDREIPEGLIPELSPALELRTALKMRDFPLFYSSLRGEAQGGTFRIPDTPNGKIPVKQNSSLSQPGVDFIGSTLHVHSWAIPGRAILPGNAHQQWENRGKTIPRPPNSRAFPTEPHLLLHSQGHNLGSIPAIPDLKSKAPKRLLLQFPTFF